MTGPFDAYCGPPPAPDALWTSWNLDPVLLFAFALVTALFLTLRRNASLFELRAFAGGMALLVIAFVSPLCALTTALFSARIVHHLLLVAFAAPLLALALPWRAMHRLTTPVFIFHTAVFWAWHIPDAYAFALSDTLGYWLMQASLLGSALLLWQAVLGQGALATRLSVLLGSIIQMGLLGALLTFAPVALYAPHFDTTALYGMTPLTDQQLGGLLMWVPAALPYLGVALMLVLPLFSGRDGRAGEPN
ncbi:cytochrome c oxidase assembly protein [Arsenicitalea aurantiaca]|uniref:Cytochrome c oxidase assembly protein n=1 Tax=Arsenicitalea aurantiaca TaxID=1783274 RepID=A0A433XMC8_9HYPH|nr:cytochrome c oxidase assembly protein [Arsenicitalea aurantiaca]RUT35203.1 cytochrome c oxidase assembly protein [Arsenicitalea aurantiaca]